MTVTVNPLVHWHHKQRRVAAGRGGKEKGKVKAVEEKARAREGVPRANGSARAPADRHSDEHDDAHERMDRATLVIPSPPDDPRNHDPVTVRVERERVCVCVCVCGVFVFVFVLDGGES
jgi:hypothetical protein